MQDTCPISPHDLCYNVCITRHSFNMTPQVMHFTVPYNVLITASWSLHLKSIELKMIKYISTQKMCNYWWIVGFQCSGCTLLARQKLIQWWVKILHCLHRKLLALYKHTLADFPMHLYPRNGENIQVPHSSWIFSTSLPWQTFRCSYTLTMGECSSSSTFLYCLCDILPWDSIE